jgi:hypothetical protein
MIVPFAVSPRRRGLCSRAWLFAAIAFLTAIPAARAQATYTADRLDGFSIFGGVMQNNTDYGQTNDGYFVGGDFTHFVRKIKFVTPSIEFRYTNDTTGNITESSFAGGIKIEKGFRRFHPYANLLVGYGAINFTVVNFSDNSIIYDAGVGLDFDVTRSFVVKIDAQEQFWKLGQASSELTPQMVGVGVLYRLPAGFGRKH